MAVDLAELLALPAEERLKLAEALWTSVAPADVLLLAAEFIERGERINHALDATLNRLENLDAVLARDRAEARDAALRSGENWPFSLSPSSQ